MSGKGRGRGRASFTFNVEAIGFKKGEQLPEAICQPGSLFPSVDFKPVPLKTGEDVEYMLALKQELRGTMKQLPYFMEVQRERPAVQRYTDKYKEEYEKHFVWTPDWRRLPRELKPSIKRKNTTGPRKVKSKQAPRAGHEDVMKKLDAIEKKDDVTSDEETEEKEKSKDGEEDEEGEQNDEEEYEEENDYIASYFEDGDDYGAGSDDNMDEATY
ncbi:DNA-directed RNA polymerase III subunit RPC7 isoform X2 [Protopterus annectens]|uniref:DNA-directed RNA polymerase III subunit RPC7 isoform X2 n=1 Tax=Protopterus annectens TaxID=7888 RepID=UPI001CFC0AFD|nr:DNA-directed RNA polymerase III subunit RPC7 isoform X2 [Protopterus annectens]